MVVEKLFKTSNYICSTIVYAQQEVTQVSQVHFSQLHSEVLQSLQLQFLQVQVSQVQPFLNDFISFFIF